MLRLLISFFLLITSGLVQADSIQAIRVSNDPASTRLVFDLNGKADYKTFTLSSPGRLVIDLHGFNQKSLLSIPSLSNTPVKSIRYAAHDAKTLRVVLDLEHTVKYETQALAPGQGLPHRLVVDLSYPEKQRSVTTAQVAQRPPVKTPAKATVPPASPPPALVKSTKSLPRREIVIAIDPGHGGKDPGAVGPRGTREKDVTLAIAKRLATLVNKEPGMRAYLTRDRDTFVSLRDRTRRASENGADMFISIHADAFHNRSARGSSVYVLSERGASSEAAQRLADKENAADLAGGISLKDKDDLLASVLLDLSQTASLEASLEVGNSVLSGLKRLGRVHKKQVESASFMVLKSPDIPSVLVETAFISNPDEERNLTSGNHQQQLAQAMMVGIRNYFQRNPLPSKGGHSHQHIVGRGDSLSVIAQRYQVSTADIQNLNNMTSSTLRVGDVIQIP